MVERDSRVCTNLEINVVRHMGRDQVILICTHPELGDPAIPSKKQKPESRRKTSFQQSTGPPVSHCLRIS